MSVRVSYDDRTNVVTLFYKHKLNFEKDRFHILKNIAAKNDIFASERTFRRIINHWKKTGCVSNKESFTRSKNKMKITEAELETLDQLIILNKETTALQAKR